LNTEIRELEEFEMLSEAFGNSGLKTMVINLILPKLEIRINKILEKLSDFSITLSTEKDKVSGPGSIDGLFIKIHDGNNQTFDYSSYSGGEKLKINISINEALASLSSISSRFYDETILALDDTSIDAFMEAMDEIQKNVKQIFMINHIQEIKELFNKTINVVKIGDTSRIK